MMNMLRNHWPAVLWIVTFNVIGAAFGLLSQDGVTGWYASSVKSLLTPPPVTFSIVWPLLYTMLGVVAYMLYTTKIGASFSKAVKVCFALQMLLNWSWPPLFFYYERVTLSFVCLLVIIVLTLVVIQQSIKVSKAIALLCAPYVIWCGFATYLNYFIMMHN